VASAWLLFFAIVFLVWIFWKREKADHSISDRGAFEDTFHKLDDAKAAPYASARARAYKQSVPIRWVPPSETVDIKGLKISAGMIYTGNVTRRTVITRELAHVIDPSLVVDAQNSDIAGNAVGYWPSFSQLRPRERRAYLQWLAEGRRDPRFGIGYVFLFFYGLEWRIFSERAFDDAKSILLEIEGLRAVYGNNPSFQSYADRFAAAARVAYGDIPTEPAFVLREQYSGELPLDLRVALGRRLTTGNLSGDWILAWYLGHPETTLKAAQRRCFDEFCRLFRLRFRERYPNGLDVHLPSERLKLSYRPASGAPLVALPGPHEKWPDPAALRGGSKRSHSLSSFTSLSDCQKIDFTRISSRAPAQRTVKVTTILLSSVPPRQAHRALRFLLSDR
jgi:hypothetical protein